jgi:hypothetical protein
MNHALIQMIFPEVFTSTSGIFVSWTYLSLSCDCVGSNVGSMREQ